MTRMMGDIMIDAYSPSALLGPVKTPKLVYDAEHALRNLTCLTPLRPEQHTPQGYYNELMTYPYNNCALECGTDALHGKTLPESLSRCKDASNFLTKGRIAALYHLPIGEAVTILGVGITVLKKFCRKENVPRKLMSLRNLIEQISEELQKAYKTGAAYQHLQDMKQRLEGKYKAIYEDPNQDFGADLRNLRQAGYKDLFKRRHGKSGAKSSSLGTTSSFSSQEDCNSTSGLHRAVLRLKSGKRDSPQARTTERTLDSDDSVSRPLSKKRRVQTTEMPSPNTRRPSSESSAGIEALNTPVQVLPFSAPLPQPHDSSLLKWMGSWEVETLPSPLPLDVDMIEDLLATDCSSLCPLPI